jgi:protoheme IX farnesyltransferase
MTRLFRLAVLSAVGTFLLIVLGGAVHLANDGAGGLGELGCGGDWPLCQGRLLPPFELLAMLEYLHRVIAASVGIATLLVMLGTVAAPAVRRRTRLTATAACALVAIQGLVGKATATAEPPAIALTAHLGLGIVFLFATLATVYFLAIDRGEPSWLITPAHAADRPYAVLAGSATLVVALFVVERAAATPAGSVLLAGLSATVLLASLLRQAPAASWRLATGAAVLAGLQALMSNGDLVIAAGIWQEAAHRAVVMLLWIMLLGSAAASWPAAVHPRRIHTRPEQAVSWRLLATPVPAWHTVQVGASPGWGSPVLAFAAPGLATPTLDLRRAWAIVAAYFALMKPGILSLLLATTLAAMLIAAAGIPPLTLVVATLVGGVLAAGGANVLNCYLDRDIDALMHRTKRRGTVTGLVSARGALVFGVSLTILAVIELGLLVNWLAAGLALAGNLYYVLIYTRLLKRRTPQNIVIGGAAGAVPPLVGWAAATGTLSVAAVLLFALIYYWTPPHFWALALLKQGEYGRAAVPMLPVVAGEAETRRQVLLYTLVMAAVSLLLIPFGMGWIYLATALLLNGVFIGLAVELYRRPSKRLARQVFFYSLWYLALIFSAMVLDRLALG